MSKNAGSVRVGQGGEVLVAPVGTAAPTSATSVPNVAFNSLGYIDADGLAMPFDQSTADIRSWEGDLLRRVVTEATSEFTFTLMETNKTVLETYFGSPAVGGKTEINPMNTGGRKAWIFDVVDDTENIRYYVPFGEVTARGEITHVRGEAIKYNITVTAYVGPGGFAVAHWTDPVAS